VKAASSARHVEPADFRSCAIPTRSPSSRPLVSRAELEAMLARMAPVVLALLADGTPRSKRAIVTALADRHDRKDVSHAVMRLAVTGRIVEHQGRFTLPAEGAELPDAG
jgi:hypothetical protein